MKHRQNYHVRLSSYGASQHYPRKPERENATGAVLDILPGGGTYVVEWSWGIAFNYPSELRTDR